MSDVNLSISQEVVRPIIEAKIQTAIAAELQGQTNLMDRVVARVMMTKVDSEGNESRYSSTNDRTYIQWLVEKAIRNAASAAVLESAETLKAKLKPMIVKELEKQKGHIAEKLVGFFGEQVERDYRFSVNIGIQAK